MLGGKYKAGWPGLYENTAVGHRVLTQLWDWSSAVGDNRVRPALRVDPLGAEIDSQVAEDGGAKVCRSNAGFFHVTSRGVGAAHHLTVGETAAGHEHRHA